MPTPPSAARCPGGHGIAKGFQDGVRLQHSGLQAMQGPAVHITAWNREQGSPKSTCIGSPKMDQTKCKVEFFRVPKIYAPETYSNIRGQTTTEAPKTHVSTSKLEKCTDPCCLDPKIIKLHAAHPHLWRTQRHSSGGIWLTRSCPLQIRRWLQWPGPHQDWVIHMLCSCLCTCRPGCSHVVKNLKFSFWHLKTSCAWESLGISLAPHAK